MKDKEGLRVKRKIAAAAAVIAVFLTSMAYSFARDVETQLWDQSVETILESTRQGRNTLHIQLKNEFISMGRVSRSVKKYSAGQRAILENMMAIYEISDENLSLYLADGSCIPASQQQDEAAAALLEGNEQQKGIVQPHISSVTGMNVFDLFIRIDMPDRTGAYLVKEYQVEDIVDSFTLSFYNDAGFSYVVNTSGDILIRPPHPNSNKTIQNLFDMLRSSQNNPDIINKFAHSLDTGRTGWAVFNYDGQDMVFCYTPVNLETDWYVVSIIPRRTINAQSREILLRTLFLIGGIVAGITLLVLFYFRYVIKTNRKLTSQASYIEHLYNSVPEGIALISMEDPYRLIQLNKEGLRLAGYPAQEGHTMPKDGILEELLESEDYKKLQDILRVTAESGEKYAFEYHMPRSGGGQIWTAGIVEKTLDDKGEPVLVFTFHDITRKRQEAEEQKRRQLKERTMLIGGISNAYPVIVDVNLTRDLLDFVYVKPGILTRIGEQKTYSQLYEDFMETIHPDSKEEFERLLELSHLRQELGEEKKEIYVELQQLLTDGRYHWVSVQIIYVDNEYTNGKNAILIARQIDEQRHVAEQQRQALQSALDSAMAASRAKGQFLSNMSHDIRTPMNAVIGMTAIAKAHIDDRERVLECLQKISLSGNHLLGLINDVLDISKIETGKIALREEPFNIADLMEDMAELVRPQADANRQTLAADFKSLRNENVIGDQVRLRQVCVNILSNAVKYTPPGGRVTVTLKQESSPYKGYANYIFRCADTGIGMSEEFLEKLFLPFEREFDSTNSKVAGTGLGMAIAKNVVELMNGEIQVESAPGKGSVFTVTFRLRIQDASGEIQPEKRPRVTDSQPPDYSRKRILIVEDNEINREIVRELVQPTGVMVEEAFDGEEGVRKVRQSPENYYDLILMDVQMPVMDGYQAARAIRAMERQDAKTVPIVAMTANAFEEDVRMAISSGMNAHFAKPVDPAALERLMGEYLAPVSPVGA